MGNGANEVDWYVPDPREGEDSPVAGMSIGEFERLADQLLWFSSLPLEARLRSLVRVRAEQACFDRLRPVSERTHAS